MSLHDDYVTLLRRGMPEHPRLYPVTEGKHWAIIRTVGEPELDGYIDEADARDLIETHALRWFLNEAVARGLDAMREYRLQSGVGLVHYLLQEVKGEDVFLASAFDPISGIVAVTEHLEPAKT